MVSFRVSGGKLWVVRFLTLLLIALVVFELSCFVGWLMVPFSNAGEGETGGFLFALLNFESSVFFYSAFLAPVLLVGLLFSWVFRLPGAVLDLVGRHVHIETQGHGRKASVDRFLGGLHSAFESMFDDRHVGSIRPVLVLIFAIVLSFLITVYPYLPGLNRHAQPVGVDIPYYVGWLTDMNKQGSPWAAFSFAFFNISDRPVSLFLMFLGLRAFGVSDWQVVKFLPMLVGPLLVLTTYFFLRKTGFSSWAASFGSLFAAFSLHVTVGMYGGFFSNWVALLLWYLSLGFLFYSLLKESYRLLAPAIVFQIALLFAHAYTWVMFLGIGAVFFLLVLFKWFKNRTGVFEAKVVFIALMVNIAAGIVRSLVLGAGVFASDVVVVTQSEISIPYIWTFWRVLGKTLGIDLGISPLNPLLYFLGFLGGVALCFDGRLVSRFFSACVVASAVPFVFGSWVVQIRILYNLPIHVFSLVGALLIFRTIETQLGQNNGRWLAYSLFALVVLVNVNYALRCSFHLTQTFL
jgi:hypothetical protein